MARIYEAVILNNGGRNGEVYSVDKSFFYRLVSTTSHVKETTNPEELFAARYSACFNGALELVLSKRGLMNKSIVTAKVSLNENEKENYNAWVIWLAYGYCHWICDYSDYFHLHWERLLLSRYT